tara:strand:+ start:3169 stop:3585 length:417 start_codon:yes stop_codon:yes gene_type:complete
MTDSENTNETESTTDADSKKLENNEKNLELNELESSENAENEPILETDDSEAEIVRMASDLEPVYDVPVKVSAVLGKTQMEVSELLKLGRGTIVELDRKVGEAIDIYVNDRLVARGEVVVVENRLGVTMTEIIKTERN